jgi:beta-lactamase class A
MTIGALVAGTAPQQVVPGAAKAVAELTTVEASDLAVVSGRPRVTVRFTAEDATAHDIARHAVERTRRLAEVLTWRVTRRVGGRWYVLPGPVG